MKCVDSGLMQEVLGHPVHWLPFGLGAGLLPWAPGSWGSLLAVGVYLVLPEMTLVTLVAVITVLFVAGVWLCGISAKKLGVHDHGGIVLDEIVGMLMVLAVSPPGIAWTVAAFAAFRLFDIWKPWPIRDLDHSVSGGFGIMLDDVLAAVYAVLLILLSERLISAM